MAGRACRAAQELHALGYQLDGKEIDAGGVAPGRLRVATSPSLTGSPPAPKTIGIVVVAALAASAAVPLPGVAITLTLRRTRSPASSANRAYWPSAQANSNATFRPSW